jgi:MFS family permease
MFGWIAEPSADDEGVSRADLLRRQLRWVTISWLFGSFWFWTINGAAMTQFARALGTPDSGFGWLAALPFIGTLMQLPAGWAIERFGHRKSLFLVSSTLGRLLWSIAAAIPWFLPNAGQWWWPAMAVTLGLSWALMNVGTPAWMSWMSDLIPRRLRGRYFGIRNMVAQPIGLLATLGIGYGLDLAEKAADMEPGLMLRVTSAILAIAGLMGALDILCFRCVHDHGAVRREQTITFREMIGPPLADPNFRLFLAFNFVFTFATAYIGQYMWLYLFDILHWSNAQANFLVVAIPILLRMGTYHLWGKLIDRVGKKPILILGGGVTVFGAVGWMLMTEHSIWPGYLLVVLTTLAWPGVEIANFNLVLDLAGSDHDQPQPAKAGSPSANPQSPIPRRASGTAYVAVFSIIVAIAGILSGLFGRQIAKSFADMPPRTFGPQDAPFTYHSILFIISTLLRAAALVFLIRLFEPRAVATRDAVRVIVGGFYSNVQRVALYPTQAVGAIYRATYRLNPPAPSARRADGVKRLTRRSIRRG